MKEYKSQITKEQSAQFEQLKQQLSQNGRKKKELKALESFLGKPKRPPIAFILFATDLRRNSSRKMSASEISVKWKALSESERKTYCDRSRKCFEQFM